MRFAMLRTLVLCRPSSGLVTGRALRVAGVAQGTKVAEVMAQRTPGAEAVDVVNVGGWLYASAFVLAYGIHAKELFACFAPLVVVSALFG